MRKYQLSMTKKVVFSTLSTILLFFLMEGIVRLLEIIPDSNKPDHIIFLSDKECRWVLAPNLRNANWLTFKNNHGIYIPLTTNSHGIRENKEIPLEKPKEQLRIAALGDSVTMGYGLPKEYCFEDRLEKRIQAELDKVIKPDSIFRDVEVINFGVNGYTTDQVRATLEKKALAYHPDILLHQVCENDVHEFYTNIILEQSVTSNLNEHYFQIWHVNDSDPGRLNRFIQASDLLRWVSASSRNIKMKRIAVKMRKLKKQILRDQYDEAFQLYSNELLKTAQIARLHGTYVLLIIPQWKEMKLKERSLFSERTIAFATANDIPFYELLFDMIDITDKLGIDRQELHIAHEDIPEDTHLNIQGSDLAAELIKHHLYRIGSLPIN